MTAKEILKENFNKALEYLSDKGKKELRAQGYTLTGKLENSFEVKIKEKLQGVLSGEILVEDYGLDLDLSPNERYKKLISTKSLKQHEADLYQYFKKRSPNLTSTEQYFFAKNTARLHFDNQIPTKNSYSFSSNGRRTGWIDASLNDDTNLEQMIEIVNLAEYYQKSLDEAIDEFLKTR